MTAGTTPNLAGHAHRIWRAHPLAWTIAAGIALIVLVFWLLFDWNWMRRPVEYWASRDTGRQVRIHGNLKVQLFSWTPNATVEGLTVSNPTWAPKGDVASIPKLYMQTSLSSLLTFSPVLLRVIATSPEITLFRDEQGRATWEFGKSAAENAKPLDLPAIRQFLIENGHVRLTDLTRHLVLTAAISSQENAGGKQTAFWLKGDGTLNKRPFVMNVTGGPLINVDRAKPYPFEMNVRAGSTRIVAHGAITHPFNLGDLTAGVVISGTNLAQLYDLTGLALPGTPPYRLSAQMVRNGRHYDLKAMHGTVGQSDMAGWASIDVSTGRPFVRADLHSRQVYLTDMGPLFGGRPPTAVIAAAAAKAQLPVAEAIKDTTSENDSSHLLPDMPLNVSHLRQMDAEVSYRADDVVSKTFPLRGLSVKINLKNGVLTADPIALAFSAGKLNGSVTIDASHPTPSVALDAHLRDISLQQFVAPGPKPIVEGVFEARARLHGTGNSVHRVASTADGTVTLVVPRGTIRQRFAELLGIDLDRALLFSGNDDTNLRCAVGGFRAQSGVLTTQSLVFDTDVVRASGTGTVDLRDETLNMQVKGEPKKFTLFRLRTPINVTGPLAHPAVGINAGGVILQAAGAVALGALATPVASLLVFVDPGLAKDADCSGLIAASTQKGTPKQKAAKR